MIVGADGIYYIDDKGDELWMVFPVCGVREQDIIDLRLVVR